MSDVTKISKQNIDNILNNYNVYKTTSDAQNQTNAVSNVNSQWWGDNGNELEIDLETGIVWETQENGEKVGMGALDAEGIKAVKESQGTNNVDNATHRKYDEMLQEDKAAGSNNIGPQKETSKGEILRANSVPSDKKDLTMDFSDWKYKVPEKESGSPKDGNYGKYDNETIIGKNINAQLTDEQKR